MCVASLHCWLAAVTVVREICGSDLAADLFTFIFILNEVEFQHTHDRADMRNEGRSTC